MANEQEKDAKASAEESSKDMTRRHDAAVEGTKELFKDASDAAGTELQQEIRKENEAAAKNHPANAGSDLDDVNRKLEQVAAEGGRQRDRDARRTARDPRGRAAGAVIVPDRKDVDLSDAEYGAARHNNGAAKTPHGDQPDPVVVSAKEVLPR